MFAFINAKLYTPDLVEDHVLLTNGDKIYKIISNAEFADLTDRHNYEIIDCGGKNLSPGFIDLQLNGCGGVSFNESAENLSFATILQMHQINVKHGCTSFLPTLITSPIELRKTALECISNFHEQHPELFTSVPGIHIEGPHLSLEKKGTHNPAFIKPMEAPDLQLYLDYATKIKMLTLAPEVNKLEDIKTLVDAGINVSLGHTNATYEQAKAAIDLGVNCATHLYNAMTSISNGRTPGVVGAIYSEPSISPGIITDGKHVDWSLVRLSLDVKGDKIFIVTDAVMPAGTDITEFTFASKTIYVRDESCFDENGVLSGSAITFDSQLRKLQQNSNYPLSKIIRLATLNPARQIKLDDQIGQLKPGLKANLTIFNDEFDIFQTYVNGKLAYHA